MFFICLYFLLNYPTFKSKLLCAILCSKNYETTGHIVRTYVVNSTNLKKKLFDMKRVFGSSLKYYLILFLMSVRTEKSIATNILRSSCKVSDIFVRL